jgi:LmbE family N-acetylglucosaminyl deacetylase
MISSQEDISKLGTILCVFAHPDDETFNMGGVLAQAAINGQRVVVVTATRGEGGVQDEARWPSSELGKIREIELKAALAELGVSEHQFLGFKDGACKDANVEAAALQIAEIIKQCQPDSIFSFGLDGLTGHPDHISVSAWTQRAWQLAGSSAKFYNVVLTPEQYAGFRAADQKFNFFFNTIQPPLCEENHSAICLHLSDDLFKHKMLALRLMPSQYDKVLSHFTDEDLRGGFGIETFVEVVATNIILKGEV